MDVELKFDCDPRSLTGFRPEAFPLVDGINSQAEGGDDSDERRIAKLRFAAVYYHLNLAGIELASARRDGGDEMAALRHIERILVVRDALETEYARIGLNAEPVVTGGQVVELKFVDPPISAPRERHSAVASVPLPPGVDVTDL